MDLVKIMRISKDFWKLAKRESKAGWVRALRFWDTIAILVIFAALIVSCTWEFIG